MEYQDYYAILGVSKNATEKQIRSAYRKLARKHHPDVNPGNKEAEEQFKKINEAYEVLSDPEKRKNYDELGPRWREYEQWERAGKQAGSQGTPFDADWFSGQTAGGARREYRTATNEDLRDLFGDEDPFSDFFNTFFGGSGRPAAGGRRRRSRRGNDLEQAVEITLAEAYTGTTHLIQIQHPDGQVRRLEVAIPPGVETGSRVRVAGQGSPGADGGASGDIYLVVSVLPDPRFERRGDDLHTRVRAGLATLMLGGEVRVPTPDDRWLALTVPGGTQDGQSFRLRGQGMPRLSRPDQRGDLHAEVHVRLPTRLTPRQRELIEELEQREAGVEDGVGTR